MADHSGKLIRHTILYMPAQLLPPLVQFATMIVWTHLLHPAAFGITTFAIAAQEFTTLIGITWWSLFVLRFRARFAMAGDERFRLMDNLVAVFAVGAQIALTLPMLWLAGSPIDWAIFLSAAGFFICRTILAHYAEWARADHRIGLFTTAQLIGTVVGSGLSIAALMIVGPDPSVALGSQAVGYGLGLVVLFFGTNLRFRVGRFDSGIFRNAMRYGLPLIVSGIFAWVAGNSIRVLVQFSDGAVGLGLLSVGWGLGQRIAAVLAMLLAAATYPLAVSHVESGDREGALEQVSLNGVFLLALLAPAMAGVTLLSPPLVMRLIAEPFRETTIMILPIAFLAAAVRGLRIHTSDQTMILLERTRATMYATIFEAGLNVIFCIVGLQLGGILGAALGILAGTTAGCIASFAYSFIKLRLPVPSGWTFLKILVATGVMSEGIRLMPTPATLSAILLTTVVGAASYAAMVVLLFPACRVLIGRTMGRFGRSYAPVSADRQSPSQLP
jgi:O-antigen/teichoic acid export membrane protein